MVMINPDFSQDSVGDLRESRIAVLETIIEQGLKSFIAVGAALAEIKAKKLYKQLGYKSFEEYCVIRWKIKRNYANKQIVASTVVSNLERGIKGTIVPNFLPTAETQIRPIARYQSDLQCIIWKKAVEKVGAVPTAKIVKETVTEVMAEIESQNSTSEDLSSIANISIGDVCIIQSGHDSDLKPYSSYWCVIKEKRDSSYDVDVYDRTVEFVKQEYLLKLDCSESQKQQAIALMERMQKIAFVDNVSGMVNAILVELSRRRDFSLAVVEDAILAVIERDFGICN